eukprot:gnl/MRDRNA2_/MRDRNA2_98505_c0_seq1.p1 gnl/MRDRNA2_/MRDRNA2_98505_c0~~gnl/MRDRNA2_/MRDRNA2_98505_c0_seq1.p1  ORF type:complete len:849 (-),score=247.20 gnl/MRDRNA2_/MRDRNA2_98505_c0_seq1:188-2428(-)
MTSDRDAFGKEASRTEMVSAMLQQAEDRCQSYQAHAYFLRRNTHGLAQSLGALAMAFTKPKKAASTKPATEMATVTTGAATATAGVGPRGGVAMDAESPSVGQTQVASSDREDMTELAPQVPSKASEASLQEHAPKSSTEDTATPKEASSLKTVSNDEPVGEKLAVSEAVDADGDAENNEDADANDEDAENGDDETATALSQKKEDQKPEAKDDDDDDAKVKTTQHDKLDEVVSKFIEGQSGSEDACHSKLLEARHQLNQLHDILTILMTKVNTTETALILYDKDLQNKLKQLVKIEKWKDAELEKCKVKKEEDTKMFLKLSEELMEMHQIAMPSVSMNMTGGDVSIGKTVKYGNRVVEETKLSLVQAALQAVPQNQPGSSSPSSIVQDLTRVPALVGAARQAASHFQTCMHQQQSTSLIQESNEFQEDSEEDSASEEESEDVIESESYEEEEQKPKKKGKKANLARKKRKNMKKDETYETSQGEAASDEKCLEEKKKLEETYVKTYVELSRLKAEYEALSKSTACFDAVNEEYDDRAPPLQEQAEKLAKLSKEAAEELKQLRPRLESAIEADKKLRKQVADLDAECKDLPETVSDLDKVRDAIRALSLCPGLYRADFKMPKFTGKLITFPQDATKQTDVEQDKAMQWACNEAFKGSRAAEFSEIEQRTVLGVPVKNDSPNALLGVCPRCAGEDSSDYKSGHARNCWAPDAPLNGDGVNTKCGKGTKSILCVIDQTSMRKIPGEGA